MPNEITLSDVRAILNTQLGSISAVARQLATSQVYVSQVLTGVRPVNSALSREVFRVALKTAIQIKKERAAYEAEMQQLGRELVA